jgi:hypothetical protein
MRLIPWSSGYGKHPISEWLCPVSRKGRVGPMHISPEGKIGIALGLVALAGAGALVVAPEPWVTGIGWIMIAAAIIGGAMLAWNHFSTRDRTLGGKLALFVVPTILIVASVFGLVTGIVMIAHIPLGVTSVPPRDDKNLDHVLSPRDLFTSDFQNLMNLNNDLPFTANGKEIKVSFRIYPDFASNAIFAAFYVPAIDVMDSTATFEMCKFIGANSKTIVAGMRNSVLMSAQAPGDASMTFSKNMVFTDDAAAFYDHYGFRTKSPGSQKYPFMVLPAQSVLDLIPA